MTSKSHTAFVSVLAAALFAAIAYLKINALLSWRYSSDLFHIDLVLQETLRGYFTMDFAYGRQFGDHACLIFLLFLPLKMLLGRWMVFVMILLAPLALALSAMLLFSAARRVAAASTATAIALIYLLSMGVLRGPFDLTYGFHIDTLSGFVAVAMAALLMRDAERMSAAAIVAIVVFGFLKEEMALLGIVFFLILLISEKTPRARIHFVGLAISTFIFAIEMVLIRLCRTQWNRGNEALARRLIGEVQSQGVFGFLFGSEKTSYWLAIAFFVAAFALLVLHSKRVNRYAFALLGTALCKLAFSWAPADFELFTWHNYPAMVMFTGAICLQITDLREEVTSKWIVRGLIACSIGWCVFAEGSFFRQQVRANADGRAERDRLRTALQLVIERVDKRKVVAIPKFTAIEWIGHRYAFFPRGITNSVQGIADLMVLPRNKAAFENTYEATAFEPIYQNGFYRLYARKSVLPEEEASRAQFIKTFGREAIGLAPPTKKKPTRRAATTQKSGS